MPSRIDASVVIPVHNGEAFVSAAIDSVLAQKHVSVEVIVVNNNSTDATRDVVRDRFGEAVLLMEEERSGAACARNAGCRVASGGLLAFLDADDVWMPDKLSRQLEVWGENPGNDILFSLGQEFHSPELDDSQTERFPCRPEPYPMLTPSSFLTRLDTFRKIGDFPEVPAGEFIAWCGWARELGMRELVVPEILVRRRIHAHNMTRTANSTAGYTLAVKWLLDQRRKRENLSMESRDSGESSDSRP